MLIYIHCHVHVRGEPPAAESDTRNLQGLGAGEHANTYVQLTCLPFHDGGALHSKHTTALLIVGARGFR